jgi:hypothetical protein
MRKLSKSKLLAFRQCPKRLWLEVHRSDLNEVSSATKTNFAAGHTVGDVARNLYDPSESGVLLDAQCDGYETVFKRTLELLDSDQPIFEAGFAVEGALSFADVMSPDVQDGKRVWRMVEVKSSTGIKDYHRDDIAIQSYIALKSGVSLGSIALAHIDSTWIYPGEGDYRGLLKECDLTVEAFGRGNEVGEWIVQAQEVASQKSEPNITTGKQCNSPFDCGFITYCQSQEPQAEYPVRWLPDIRSKNLKKLISDNPALDLRDTPNPLLNELQMRVKEHTLSGEVYFDAQSAAIELEQYGLPAYFLDFETIQFAVPIWKGIRPYQFIPFQFSLHILNQNDQIESKAFLDISGSDPSYSFAETLLKSCGIDSPIYVYNVSFEGSRRRLTCH